MLKRIVQACFLIIGWYTWYIINSGIVTTYLILMTFP